MKKWIILGLIGLLLAAIALSLSLYWDGESLSQEVNVLKAQRNQESQERDRQATIAAGKRSDLISVAAKQKEEVDRIQKLLDTEKETSAKLAQTAAAKGQTSSDPLNPDNSVLGHYQNDLESVRQDLLELHILVDKLKEYAATLEKNLNLPAPDFTTPIPTSTLLPVTSPVPSSTTSTDTPLPITTLTPDFTTPTPTSTSLALSGVNEEKVILKTFNEQLLSFSQDLSTLGNEVRESFLNYSRVETAANGVAHSNLSSNNSVTPSIVAAILGTSAEKLAALSYAPQGWPVHGPITSPFGPRPILIITDTTTNSKPEDSGTTVAEGKGGNNPTTARAGIAQVTSSPTNTTTPTPTSLTGNRPATIPIQTNITPAIINRIPMLTTITPTLTLTPFPALTTTTPTFTATTTPTVAPETTITTTLTVLPDVTPTATPELTPTPSINLKEPVVSSSSIEVGSGMEFHTGIDIGVVQGTLVKATASGVVEYAGDGRGGYGQVVFINHPGGFITIYGHNSRLLVVAGQTVKAGEVIALSGNTGYSTGPHVHYEIRYQNQVVDPAPFLKFG